MGLVHLKYLADGSDRNGVLINGIFGVVHATARDGRVSAASIGLF